MYAVTINDFVGASAISLYRSGIDEICSTFTAPQSFGSYYYCDLYPHSPSLPPSSTNILTIEIYKINMKTIKTFEEMISEFNPEMVIVYSSQPAYTSVKEKEEWKEVVNYIEEGWNYIIAGFTPNTHFNEHAFMVDPWGFGSAVSEGNTYIVAFDKERYMDFAKEIRGRRGSLPMKSRLPKFHKPLSDFMVLPLNGPGAVPYYLTTKQYRHLHTKNATYKVINNQTMIPSLSPEEMLHKDEYYLIQDDPWQVQQVNPGNKINSEGLRFPTPDFYTKIKGYVGYCGLLDDGTDAYHCYVYSNDNIILDPYRYAYSVDMYAMMDIIKKYVKILREFNRRI